MICGLEPGMGCTSSSTRSWPASSSSVASTKARPVDHENARIPQRRFWDCVMLNLIHEEVGRASSPGRPTGTRRPTS